MHFTFRTPGRDLVVQIGELVLAVLAAVVIALVWNQPTSADMDAKERFDCDLHCDSPVGEY